MWKLQSGLTILSIISVTIGKQNNRAYNLLGTWSTSWNNFCVEGIILPFDEVSDAPVLPGLYSWYAGLGLGELDIADETQTRSALSKQTSKYKPSSLISEIKGNFGALWKGELLDKSMDKLSFALSNEYLEYEEQTQENRLNRTLSELSTRKALISNLENCVPVFMSPLYIGISENLRRRLSEHVRIFRAIYDQKKSGRNDQNYEEESLDDFGNNFAFRAVQRGFKEDNLKVFVLPFEGLEDMTQQQIRDIISSVEFLVNRWSKPSLGER